MPYGVQMMVDFKACSWPAHLDATGTSLAAHFDEMNEEPVADVISALAAQAGGPHDRPPVITFSHFLPHQASLCFPYCCCHTGDERSSTCQGMLCPNDALCPCHAMPAAMWLSLLAGTVSKFAETDSKHAAVGNCAGAAAIVLVAVFG